MPVMFGRWDDIVLEDLVCSDCNSKFSRWETLFKETTFEGFATTLYGLNSKQKSTQVRPRDLNFQIVSDTELGIFSKILPKVDVENNVIYPQSQIALSHKESRKIRYFKLSTLDKLALRGNREFKKKRSEIKRLYPFNISIFADKKQGWTMDKVIEILKKYGIKDYKEKATAEFPKLKPNTRLGVKVKSKEYSAESIKGVCKKVCVNSV
jgi:hypothetical protein